MMAGTILRIIDLVEFLSLSKPTIYRLIKRGQFPIPIKLGSQAVGWLKKDVELWLEDRIAIRDGIVAGSGTNEARHNQNLYAGYSKVGVL